MASPVAAGFLKPCGGRDLIDRAGLLVIKPGQKPYHRGAILPVYGGAAGNLRCVLAGAGQAGGIGRIENRAAGLFDQQRDRMRRDGWINHDPRAGFAQRHQRIVKA
jgi:hypothetical protein